MADLATDFLELSEHGRRTRLVQVVEGLLADHALAQVTFERVAAAAGTTVRAVRHYFPLQRDLHVSALANAVDGLGEEVLPHLDLPPREAALECVETYIQWADDRAPQFQTVLTSGTGQPGLGDVMAQVREQTVRLVLGELSYSEAHPPPAPVVVAVAGWVSFMNTAMLLRLETGGPTARALSEQLVRTLAGALAAGGDDASSAELAG